MAKRRRRLGCCEICGSVIHAENMLSGVNDPLFCSADCLVSYIRSPKDIPASNFLAGLKHQNILHERNAAGPDIFDNGVCYSHSLMSCFRSFFEVAVAEAFVLYYKELIYYEPFELNLTINNKQKIYVPDFFLPVHGVFLEVKGAWLHGGKKKFLTALSILGKHRLVLVPPYLKDDFRHRCHEYQK